MCPSLAPCLCAYEQELAHTLYETERCLASPPPAFELDKKLTVASVWRNLDIKLPDKRILQYQWHHHPHHICSLPQNYAFGEILHVEIIQL